MTTKCFSAFIVEEHLMAIRHSLIFPPWEQLVVVRCFLTYIVEEHLMAAYRYLLLKNA